MQVMAYYGGGAPMIDADVEIYTIKDGQEELYLTGKTDLEGMFYFEPKIGVSDYRAVVEATGHRGYEFVNLTGGAGVPEAEQEGTELPLREIIAGFGYLAGLIGISMILAARKMKK
jgi:nickel transport protein